MFAFRSSEGELTPADVEQQLLQRLQQRLRLFVVMVAVLRMAPVFLGPAVENPGSS